MGNRCADHVTSLYPQKLALTSLTGGGRSVGIVRSRTKATELSFSLYIYIYICMYVCMYLRKFVCKYISVYVYMYVFVLSKENSPQNYYCYERYHSHFHVIFPTSDLGPKYVGHLLTDRPTDRPKTE